MMSNNSHASLDTVIGLDGCRRGWLGALWSGPGHRPSAVLLTSLAEAETKLAQIAVIAVDIPLGLLAVTMPGGRLCDRQARQLLGPRASSVFPPPAKIALSATDFQEASCLNRQSGPHNIGLSKQCFGIFPKLKDAEQSLAASGWLRDHVIEVHPELCFAEMAGSPSEYSKKTPAGKAERRKLLQYSKFEDLTTFERDARILGASTDDALDACAAAWTAWRYLRGVTLCLPTNAETPNCSMRIWY